MTPPALIKTAVAGAGTAAGALLALGWHGHAGYLAALAVAVAVGYHLWRVARLRADAADAARADADALARARAEGERTARAHLATVAADPGLALIAWDQGGRVTLHAGGAVPEGTARVGDPIDALFAGWPEAVLGLAALRAGEPEVSYLTGTPEAPPPGAPPERVYRVTLRADAERPGAGSCVAVDVTEYAVTASQAHDSADRLARALAANLRVQSALAALPAAEVGTPSE